MTFGETISSPGRRHEIGGVSQSQSFVNFVQTFASILKNSRRTCLIALRYNNVTDDVRGPSALREARLSK